MEHLSATPSPYPDGCGAWQQADVRTARDQTRTHLVEAMRIARWQGAGTIFFTDRDGRSGQTDPFAALPRYWDEIVSRIGPGISE
ncbi:hypothetical protein SMICM17S_09323 [Streptomyces microflavus]